MFRNQGVVGGCYGEVMCELFLKEIQRYSSVEFFVFQSSCLRMVMLMVMLQKRWILILERLHMQEWWRLLVDLV